MVIKLLAAFLALVVANPVCCCAFTSTSNHDEAPVHSCCAGGSDSGPDREKQPDDRQDRKCTCHLDQDKAATEVELPRPGEDRPDSGRLPRTMAAQLGWTANLALVEPLASKWPPGHLRPPSLLRRLARHGSYRL